MADDALHAIAHGDPLPRLVLLDVAGSPSRADLRAAELVKLPQLRGFWLVERAAKTEQEQATE